METASLSADELRKALVDLALEWERRYGAPPFITSVISEYDAALLVGHTAETYGIDCQGRTAVTRGTDFCHDGIGYQIKACRPSGKPGSVITWVPKATHYEWDRLIWLRYDREFKLLEAWEWPVENYKKVLEPVKRLSPAHMRTGRNLLPADCQTQ